MKVLILVADYPDLNGKKALYYVHSRNLYYHNHGVQVIVINFKAKKDYIIDNIPVITLDTYKSDPIYADILISHAANLRNHYLFLVKYGKRYPKKVFIFHGHEILHINKYYPKPYSFIRQNRSKEIFQNVYDSIKIYLWKKYFLSNISRVRLVFVSNWLFQQFLKEFKIQKDELKEHYAIIPNSIGSFFQHNEYCPSSIKYDFLTIRNYLDGSKYCVDLIVELAKDNPQYKFCLIGTGNYFSYNYKPGNIAFFEKEMSHEEMQTYIDSSRYALMLTREDTHGLMAAELASYGIPLITSDIEICREVFSDCPNVMFVSNDHPSLQFDSDMCKNSDWCKRKWDRFFDKNTVAHELNFLFDFSQERE